MSKQPRTIMKFNVGLIMILISLPLFFHIPSHEANLVSEAGLHHMPQRECEVKIQKIQVQLTEYQQIEKYVYEISKQRKVDPRLIMSVIYHESRFDPNEKTGQCLGLMQVSVKWHSDRAQKLEVTNFYDPKSNIIGVDYLVELLDKYEDPALALMMYNMKHADARKMYASGKISYYAKSVLDKTKDYKKGE